MFSALMLMGEPNRFMPPGINLDVGTKYPTMREASKPHWQDTRGFKVTPGMVLGTLVGVAHAVSSGKTRKEIANLPLGTPPKTPSSRPKNFYVETKDLIDNMSTVFTPVSVVYQVKTQGTTFNIDTVETSEMTDAMKQAWSEKNDMFFRNLMLAKIHSEAQLAEQAFTRKMIESQLKKMGKVAEEEDLSSKAEFELSGYINKIAEQAREQDGVKVAVLSLVDEMEKSGFSYEFSWELDRPFDKYAGIVASLAQTFIGKPLGFQTSEARFSDPAYLKLNTSIGFMPDRVVFVVDGVLMGTLSVLNMNEEGYEKFLSRNTGYFKEYFLSESKKGVRAFKKNASEKTEESSVIDKNPFNKQKVDPSVYNAVLSEALGKEWQLTDLHVLIKLIEDMFLDGEPIEDVALNKIMAIQTVKLSDLPFESYHAFEKTVRAINGRSLDFFRREQDDIEPSEILLTIVVMQELLPESDIYDKFSPEVIKYISDTLAMQEVYSFSFRGVSFELKDFFLYLVNNQLVKSLSHQFIAPGNFTKEEKDAIKASIVFINGASEKIYLDFVESKLSDLPPDNALDKEIVRYADQIGYNPKDNDMWQTRIQIKHLQSLDRFLESRDHELERQRNLYMSTKRTEAKKNEGV